MVQRRVLNLGNKFSPLAVFGIRCEIAHCEWADGKPKRGHLQEAARDMRYEQLQRICSQHRIGVLLIAHHVDDQDYLAIVACLDLLICKGSKQEWVEDPTNQKTIFARNRIRMSLGNLSSCLPMKMKSFSVGSSNGHKVSISSELDQIIENERLYTNKIVLNTSDVPFLNTSCDSILTEAKRVNIISEPTFTNICSLHKPEHENFKLKTEIMPDHESRKLVESVGAKELLHGKIGNFKERFLVPWEFIDGNDGSCCCGLSQDSVLEVRHMADAISF
uniref:Lysidine-tRNA(Ile) synthetase n=1 Tax=Tanacetum cinerariifolium TaxID=118510 RepID=A0A6L2LSM8_TANCI|nr:lysidine-tRNA(Ile) synthetase [Tanacetum cinerariifolium]